MIEELARSLSALVGRLASLEDRIRRMKAPASPHDTLTFKEAAQRLSMPADVVERMCMDGGIILVFQGEPRVLWGAVLRLAEARGASVEPAPAGSAVPPLKRFGLTTRTEG